MATGNVSGQAGGRAVPHAGSVRREGDRTWVEGLPRLAWDTGRANTFLGCLEAALSVTGRPFSFGDLAGYSGMAFRVRWYRGDDGLIGCPSSSVGEFPEEQTALASATGWRLHGEFGPDLRQRRSDIVRSIDAGLPALVYDMGWDVAVCEGYLAHGDILMVRSYGGGEVPADHRADALPGYLLLLAGHGEEPHPRARFFGALERAPRLWRREPLRRTDPDGEYLYGQSGYDAWMGALRMRDSVDGNTRGRIEHASGMNYVTLLDTRVCAAAFMRAHCHLVNREAADALEIAAAAYDRQIAVLSPTNWADPARQPDLLAGACRLEADAVTQIGRALTLVSNAGS